MNNLKISLCALLAMCALTTQAHAALITFDDLNCPSETEIPDGYMGFDWENFWCLDAVAYTASGYKNGMVSEKNVAFNAFASPASLLISALNPGQTFSLSSAYITGAWNNGLEVRVEGFLNGQPVYDQVFTVNYDAPTLVQFNPAAVDVARFSSSGGTDAGGDTGIGTHFAMDNLIINAAAVAPVPVPTLGFWGMLALILGSGAIARQRLRKRT